MKTPELLAPAGNLRNLRYAVAYGADAVYAGMPRYSLRVRNNDFHRLDNLATGIREAHAAGKAFFLASNVLPHNSKVDTFLHDMEAVVALGPDALIMADPGLILLVRERWPQLRVHLSVQANTMNYASVRFWQRQGIGRVILSRELSLRQVEEIRQACPDIEIEVFVHGALCIAYSGRCLLSGYFNHRDANQGTCTNACRWEYRVQEACTDSGGELQPQRLALVEERQRPGELMPVEEDEHGTYVMNSRDLRAVQHVARLVAIGIDSLKIEGRTKSHYYTARTAQIYRRAIDDAVAGRPFDTTLMSELDHLANRGYTDGFLQRHPDHTYQNYESSQPESSSRRFVAELLAYDAESGLGEFEVKNRFAIGDRMELIVPQGNLNFTLETMQGSDGAALREAPGSGYRVRIPLPANRYSFALLARHL